MQTEYDGHRIINNIMSIIDKRGMKIGDVEFASDLSQGYFSRQKKKDVSASLSVETITKIASCLGTSIDMLVFEDLTQAKDNTQKMYNFITKLRTDTDGNQTIWTPITTTQINAMLKGDEEPIFIIRNKKSMASIPNEGEESGISLKHYGENYICSAAVPQAQSWVIGSSFYTELNEDERIYIFHMGATQGDDKKPVHDVDFYDLYLFQNLPVMGLIPAASAITGVRPQNWHEKLILSTLTNGTKLENPMEMLYKSISRKE